jgi:hypothetical protein
MGSRRRGGSSRVTDIQAELTPNLPTLPSTLTPTPIPLLVLVAVFAAELICVTAALSSGRARHWPSKRQRRVGPGRDRALL